MLTCKTQIPKINPPEMPHKNNVKQLLTALENLYAKKDALITTKITHTLTGFALAYNDLKIYIKLSLNLIKNIY